MKRADRRGKWFPSAGSFICRANSSAFGGGRLDKVIGIGLRTPSAIVGDRDDNQMQMTARSYLKFGPAEELAERDFDLSMTWASFSDSNAL